MKVLVTGATGYIGSVIVERLIARGHHAQALVRSERAAAQAAALGAEPVVGDLSRVAEVAAAAARADAVIHTAIIGGSVDFDPTVAFPADRRVVEAIIGALRGSGRPFVATSGGMAVGVPDAGRSHPVVHTEETPFIPPDFMRARVDMENSVLAGLTHGLRSIVIRPPYVYGRNGCYAIETLIESARRHRVAAYVGEGENIWSMVHVDDLAELYVLAMELAPAGHLFNATTSEISLRELASLIGRVLDVPVASWSLEDAAVRWGEIRALILSATHRSDSAKARRLLGWHSRAPSVKAEIEAGTA